MQGESDHTLFYKHSRDEKFAILIVYVDYITIIGDVREESDALKGYGQPPQPVKI